MHKLNSLDFLIESWVKNKKVGKVPFPASSVQRRKTSVIDWGHFREAWFWLLRLLYVTVWGTDGKKAMNTEIARAVKENIHINVQTISLRTLLVSIWSYLGVACIWLGYKNCMRKSIICPCKHNYQDVLTFQLWCLRVGTLQWSSWNYFPFPSSQYPLCALSVLTHVWAPKPFDRGLQKRNVESDLGGVLNFL